MSSDANIKKSAVKHYVQVFIVLFFMYGFRFLPPIEPITQAGMGIIGILPGLIYGWTFVAIGWPSLAALPALMLTGVATKAQIWGAALGSETLMITLLMLIFAAVLESTNAMTAVANWAMTRKLLKGRPWFFSFALLLVCIFAGTIAPFGMLILFLNLMRNIAKQFGLEPYSKYVTLMYIGITLAILDGSALLPFKGGPLILFGVYQNISGETVSSIAYFFVGTFIKATSLLLYILICKYILKPDVSKLQNIDVQALGIENVHFTGQQKISLLTFIVLVVVLLTSTVLSATIPLFAALDGSGWILIALVFLSVYLYKGQAIANLAKNAKDGVTWDTIYLCIIIVPLSGFVNTPATGIGDFLTQNVVPIFSGLGPVGFLILLFVVSVLLTSFMTNLLVASLLIPVATAVAPTVGLAPAPIVVLLILVSHLALATPAASPYAAIMFSYSDIVRPKELIPYSIFCCVLIGVYYLVLYKFVCLFF